MGEVYRVHDVRLEQDVALKLLPAPFADDPDRRSRFQAEVRAALKVSHPNVCRVHYLGEHEGRLFLTMELVQGGDLSTLLRQVGRLPEERALTVARQLCSAVSAVHAAGLLHRDLKPANVLLDEKGDVRLVDFGIAALAGRVTDVSSGTAAYQAPEVLAGKEVTVASDLFALGLVLYEVFTGKQAFPARAREELARMHRSGPTAPSSHGRPVDPAVDRIILRCLASNPEDRPRSAEEVQAALPGALQAAVDAGETPSPGFIADAGGSGELSPMLAGALLASTLTLLLVCAWLTDLAGLHRRLPMKAPAVLRDRAGSIAQSLGLPEPVDEADGLLIDHRSLSPAPAGEAWRRLEKGHPVAIFYWVRLSPRRLVHRFSPNDILGYSIPGMVSVSEPALGLGEACLLTDGMGRLIELHHIPRKAGEGLPPWPDLFAAAGLEIKQFRADETPQRLPGAYADTRAAWVGPHPDFPGEELRVEAASLGGSPVYFWVGLPSHSGEDDRAAMTDVPTDIGTWLAETVLTAIRLLAVTLGAALAYWNVRAGLANLAGAWRLAAVYASAYLLMWLAMAHHSYSPGDEWAILAAALGLAVLNGLTMWVIYLALEPSVRRLRPAWMIAWNRLLEGRWNDPRVGSEILLGAVLGSAWACLVPIRHCLLPEALGLPFVPYPPWMPTLTVSPLGPLFCYVWYPLFIQSLEFFVIILVFLVSRRLSVAALAWGAFWTVRWMLTADAPFSTGAAILTALATGLALTALLRGGLLAFVAFGVFGFTLVDLPVTLDSTAFYAWTGRWALIALTALAVFAWRTSTGDGSSRDGRRAWGGGA
jgi:serine/threonine-protein kinase